MYRSIGQCCSRIAPSQYAVLTQNAKPAVVAIRAKTKFHTSVVRSSSPSKPIQSSPAQQVRTVTMAKLAAEPFMNGTSSVYIEEMYHAWLDKPDSVHKVRYFHFFKV